MDEQHPFDLYAEELAASGDVLVLDPCPEVVELSLDRIAADVGTELAWALAAAPSAHVMSVLRGLDPRKLSGDERVDLIKAWERSAAWVAAQQQHALAAVVEATEELGLEGHCARHEVAAALRVAPGTAYDRCQRARELTGRLGESLAELDAGRISVYQANSIADAVDGLDDSVARAVQTRVLSRAWRQTTAETKQAIRRALIALDPTGAAQRAERAFAERIVTTQPLDDAMTEVRAVVRATDAELLWQALSERAAAARVRLRLGGESDPGLDALRADAFVAAVVDGAVPTGSSEAGERPAVSRRSEKSVQVRVTVDLPTLLGLADNPAELAGYGPIPAPMACALAHDADWVRWTTDPQPAQLLDAGATTYRPSRALGAFVKAAHPRCGWVGCRHPATRCDVDHVVDFHNGGGRTIRANLGPLCRQHHNAKTHGGWQYTRAPDNTGHLRSPLGHTYEVEPPHHGPDP